MLVDSHTHISEQWFEPVEVLLFQLDRVGIERAVGVQFSGCTDNDYLLAAARAFPDRLSAVVSVDLAGPDPVAELQRCAEAGATGLRIGPLDGEPALWEAAARLGLTISCYGTAAAFGSAEFAARAQGLPALPIVAEHLGDLRRNGQYPTADSSRALFLTLAQLPNLLVKLHGIGETSARAARLGATAYEDPEGAPILAAYDVLGPSRILWGSGFPSVSSREGYANSYRHPRDVLRAHGMTADEEALVFGGNAARLF